MRLYLTSEFIKRFQKLFQGLGKQDGEYNIKLVPNTKPFAMSASRELSLLLVRRVKEEMWVKFPEKIGVQVG